MTNENTEFDLVWAKRGGVILVCERATGLSRYCKLVDALGDWGTFINLSSSGSAQILISCAYPSSISDIDDELYSITRIATRDECTASGIEYIERPVSAEELKSLREDKEMLEFMIKDANITYLTLISAYDNETPRETIRAAIKGGM